MISSEKWEFLIPGHAGLFLFRNSVTWCCSWKVHHRTCVPTGQRSDMGDGSIDAYIIKYLVVTLTLNRTSSVKIETLHNVSPQHAHVVEKTIMCCGQHKKMLPTTHVMSWCCPQYIPTMCVRCPQHVVTHKLHTPQHMWVLHNMYPQHMRRCSQHVPQWIPAHHIKCFPHDILHVNLVQHL